MHFQIYSRYFYSKLTNDEKQIYTKLQEAWLNYKEKVIIRNTFIHVDFQKIFEAVREDTPELFYIDTTQISAIYLPGAVVLATKFIYSRSDCENYKNQIMCIVDRIRKQAKQSSDKEKCIHDYLVSNVSYSKDTNDMDAYTIKGAFLSGQAVCEGYSRSFKLLCDGVGIPCVVIRGVATSPNGFSERHAWNIVKLGDSNFHVDTTWNRPLYCSGLEVLYYNVSDSIMRRDHKWDENKWPSCSKAGTTERSIVLINSPTKLDEQLRNAVSNKIQSLTLNFNRQFSSSSKLQDIIKSSLNKINAENKISNYVLHYGSRNDLVTIKFTFR